MATNIHLQIISIWVLAASVHDVLLQEDCESVESHNRDEDNRKHRQEHTDGENPFRILLSVSKWEVHL